MNINEKVFRVTLKETTGGRKKAASHHFGGVPPLIRHVRLFGTHKAGACAVTPFAYGPFGTQNTLSRPLWWEGTGRIISGEKYTPVVGAFRPNAMAIGQNQQEYCRNPCSFCQSEKFEKFFFKQLDKSISLC